MASTQHNAPEEDGNIDGMWANQTSEIAHIDPQTENWKSTPLPLARIKKIMKSEEGVYQEMERERLEQERASASMNAPANTTMPGTRFMIAGEAPVLMGKACELMIKELTIRSWRHTERSRRRTLQKQDIHAGVGESEVYDFLIDIIPRGPPQSASKGGSVVQHSDVLGEHALSGITGMSAAPAQGNGQPTEQGMTLSQAETRYAQLQEQLRGQYEVLQHSGQIEGELSTEGAVQALQQNWSVPEPESPAE